VAAKSVAGINRFMFYFEIFLYLHNSAYAIHKGFPFSIYGENLIMMFQNYILIMLIWTYEKEVHMFEKIFTCIFITLYSFMLYDDKLISEQVWVVLTSSQALFILCSRLPQIRTNYNN